MMERIGPQALVCPKRTGWVSFRLVDEFGNGAAYAGLPFVLHAGHGEVLKGVLDRDGYYRYETLYCGPSVLELSSTLTSFPDSWYEHLQLRQAYPLPLTELQIAAEQTPIGPRRADGRTWMAEQRALEENARFFRVEVSDFVAANKHLPDPDEHWSPRPSAMLKAAMPGMEGSNVPGIALEPNQHHVLEVKALRAYRPLFSLSPEFSALNAYHLAVMSDLVYAPFSEKQPSDTYQPKPPPYQVPGSIGHVLREQLATQQKAALFNRGQHHLLYEEVAYSKRLEVVPYDPELYIEQKNGETPESVHFLHDHTTHTQAFVTHNDRMILISVRGTEGLRDWLRDFDARQIVVDEFKGEVHRGFHGAFIAVEAFIRRYLNRFYIEGQSIIVCGHSLGGAIALLLAEYLRRKWSENLQLYTFGAPRAGNATFVESAKGLVHHRLVNHNDPVPGVPFAWLDAEWRLAVPGAAMLLGSLGTPHVRIAILLAGLVNLKGDGYQHHGEQYHFMPRKPGAGIAASVLWQPGCEAIEQSASAACAAELAIEYDMPTRSSFVYQLFQVPDHSISKSYTRAALANLLRWHASLERGGALFTAEEQAELQPQLQRLEQHLAAWEAGTFQEFEREVRKRYDTRFYYMTKTQRRHAYFDGVDKARAEREQQRPQLYRAERRLVAQAKRLITAKDLFGDQVVHEELPRLLDEWLQLAEIRQAQWLVQRAGHRATDYA